MDVLFSFHAPGGFETLHDNTTGDNNTASGLDAPYSNTSGSKNIAAGYRTLFSNTAGVDNTATGVNALYSNTTSGGNAAYGLNALFNHTTGNSNTGIGANALLNSTTGSSNIALGSQAGASLTTGSNNIDIGAPGVAGESAKIRIGRQGTQDGTYIAGILGATAGRAPIPVYVGPGGKLGTVASSASYKEAVKPMDDASKDLLKLEPVTFHYKKEIDPDGALQFGLVAEEVEKVNPDLVAHDEEGKPYTVRYDAVNAMLLNEFLKEHRKNEEQGAKIAQLERQLETMTATLQKVSAQLATRNGATGMRSDIDGPSREAGGSGSEQVNPSLADSR